MINKCDKANSLSLATNALRRTQQRSLHYEYACDSEHDGHKRNKTMTS